MFAVSEHSASKSVTINFKKLLVKECDYNMVDRLVEKYHYLGEKDFRSGYCYSLCEKANQSFGDLTAIGKTLGGLVWHGVSVPNTVVGAFGLDRDDQEGMFELGRFVLITEANQKNVASFFLSKSIKMLQKKTKVRALITYADSEHHKGTLYKACNFKYYGLTDPKTDFFDERGKRIERGEVKSMRGQWLPRSRKHRYMIVFDKNLNIKWREQPYIKNNNSTETSPDSLWNSLWS